MRLVQKKNQHSAVQIRRLVWEALDFDTVIPLLAWAYRFWRQKSTCSFLSEALNLAANCVKYDPDEMYNTDVFIGERQESKDITLAESYVRLMKEIADIDVVQFYGQFGELSRVIPYINGRSDGVARKIFELFRNNAEQVKRAISDAVKYYSDVF